MNKLIVILWRECRTRLRRPGFWVLCLLVPVVLAALYALPVVAARHKAEPTLVAVVDETGLFAHRLRSTSDVHFTLAESIDHAQRLTEDGGTVLLIPLRETTIPRDAFLYYSGRMPSLAVQSTVDNQLQHLLQRAILRDVYNIDPTLTRSIEDSRIALHTREVDSHRDSHLEVRTALGVALALLVVLALLSVLMQTMRAVQEERQNRIAELMSTSVRQWQLLGGKMGSVALCAILQLAIWIVLTATAISVVQASAPELFEAARTAASTSIATKGEAATAQYAATTVAVDQAVAGLADIRLPLAAGIFALFFLLAYALYGGLAAALAARLDSEADALQWSLLLLSPLLLCLVAGGAVLQHPSGTLAVWLSLLPPTAPAAVLLRLPFGLPTWQVWLAAALLVAAALASIALASRAMRRHRN